MAKRIQLGILLVLVIFSLVKFGAAIYEIALIVYAGPFPPEVARFRMETHGRPPVNIAGPIAMILLGLGSVVIPGLFFIIFRYKWLLRVWERVDEEYWPHARPAVKAACFSGLWSAVLQAIPLVSTSGGIPSPVSVINLVMYFAWGTLLGYLFYRAAGQSKRRSWPWFGLLVLVVSIATIVSSIFSFWLVRFPLSFFPLERTPETEAVFVLAEQENFPVEKIYLIPGMANAFYFNGLVGEFIALGTPFFGELKSAVPGVMAHELGHRAHGHTYVLYAILLLQKLLGPLLSYFVVLPFPVLFYQVFDLALIVGDPAALVFPIGESLGMAVQTILEPLKLWVIRQMEYDADQFAVSKGTGKEVASFLASDAAIAMNWENSALFEWLYLDHPSPLRRIRRIIEKLDKR